MALSTIDDVIMQLDAIITSEKQKSSCLVFFPILYKMVTVRVKDGIANNEFADGERMEQLDIIFAGRYIDAHRAYVAGEPCTQSWLRAFDAVAHKNLLIMQHLLLGINAHINLDLGIAASQTMRGGYLADFEGDFDKINEILGSMVAGVKDKIKKVSPMFGLFEKLTKGKEDKVVSFSINVARDGAWMFANEYHAAPNKAKAIDERDVVIAALAAKLISPKSKVVVFLMKAVKFFEQKDVAATCLIMEQ
ncbi:MAG: hypothetical protein CL868_03170 [Cytophagaceae bacterium]|nr:hypothetical protein [Cytophagaceae bacterium]